MEDGATPSQDVTLFKLKDIIVMYICWILFVYFCSVIFMFVVTFYHIYIWPLSITHAEVHVTITFRFNNTYMAVILPVILPHVLSLCYK